MAEIIATDVADPSLTSTTDHNGQVVYQEPTVYATTGESPDPSVWDPIKIVIETSRFKETARLDATGLWPDGQPPESGQIIRVNINSVRAYTGWIDEVKPQGDGSHQVVAFDLVKKLLRTQISHTFNDAPLETIARTTLEQIPEADAPIGGIDLPNITASPEYTNTPATSVLDQVAKWGNVLWWADHFDNVHISEPDSKLFELGPGFVKPNSTAGEGGPPYERVVVRGRSAASQSSAQDRRGGHQASHMESRNPITATAGQGEPVYNYESRQIRTQQQAQNVADAILNEFRRQRASGKVTVVGEGIPIRPLDAIQVPAALGGIRYLVSSIKHTFSNDDGLISEVSVGGYIDG